MSTPSLTLADKPHIIIRASAGSGKTYQLSNRYLDLLHRDAAPATILATTFTRKAAGEILERILRRLAEAATNPEERARLAQALKPATGPHRELTPGRVQEMLKTLCRSLHRASVSTIDSFFHRIASCFRHELKLPPDPKLVDGSDALATRLRLQAIEAMLGDEDVDLLIDLLKRLHHDQTRRTVTQAIDDIVGTLYDTYRTTRREHWHQLDAPSPLAAEEVMTLIDQLEDLLAAADNKPLVKALGNARQRALQSDWKGFLSSGLPPKILADPIEPVFSGKPVTDAQLEVFTPLIAHAKAVLLTYLDRQTQATYDLLHRFDGHYTRLRQQQRLLLYSDLPFKLAHELPRHDETLLTEICYRLDGSVGHLLLDEFQDTSFDQWRVLAPFAQEVTAHGDGSRTFFCVGDVKQAIYGWRGGRAELFDQIPEQLNLSADAQVTLDVSRRSSQIVLDVVNRVFHSLPASQAWTAGETDRAEAAAWAGDFREHHAFDRKLRGHVEFIASPPIEKKKSNADYAADPGNDADEDDSLPEEYESFVADRIAGLHRNMPSQSIGVLVSTNKAAAPLLDHLRALGVDASAEGRSQFTGDPAVEAVLSALRLADHPGHTAAAFHVLNSPLASIIGLRSMHPRDAAATALHIRTRIVARGFAGVLASWARDLAPSCDQGSARRLLQLIELADRYEIDATARLGPFVEAVEHADFEEPSTSPVRVMTIHKSKGLEFDIVVLPQLDKRMGNLSRNDGVTILREPNTDEVLAVYRGTSDTVRKLSPVLRQAHEQERMRRLRDDLCMLYVAMTRARHALHLIAPPVSQNKTGLGSRGLRDQSFASLLRHALCDDPEAQDPDGNQTLYTHGDSQWCAASIAEPVAVKQTVPASPRIDRSEQAEPAGPRAWRIVSPSSLHQQGRRSIGDLLVITPDEARSRGTLIHAWFQQIQWLDDQTPPPSDEALAQAAARTPPIPTADWLASQIEAFRRMIAQPGVRQCFAAPTLATGQQVDLWRERPFAVRLNNELLRGSFDRVAIIRQGGKPLRAELLDFKTDRLRGSRELSDRINTYRPQIEAYRNGLAAMLNLPRNNITASLLFVETGRRQEIQ